MDQALLKPIKLGAYTLPNRVFMAPLTRSRSVKQKPEAITVTYYQQRASAGLIISEGTPPSKQGVGYPYTPGIHSEEQVKAWKNVTAAVHERDGHIFCQLWHCGRMSLPVFHNGELPVAPSAVNPNWDMMTPEGTMEKTVTPRALTIDEIKQTVQDYAQAAKNAIEAGFDGVEIHAANGYLIHQFINNCSNQRTDEYGGSIENKARFLFEVLDAVGNAIGFDKTGIRLNPSMHNLHGMSVDSDTIPTFDYIVERLNSYPELAYLHLTEPMTPVHDVPGAVEHIAQHFRPIYKGTLVINCGFDQDKANRVISEGQADAVAFGKPFISNPDLVERIQQNLPWAAWDDTTFYTRGEKGYIDYPTYSQSHG